MLAIEPLRALLELARAHLAASDDHTPGDGQAVVLFPLGADHSYMASLAKHCERLGYACHHWGRGRNTGPQGSVAAWLRELAADTDEIVRPHRQKVTLIGCSLGGLYAREVAKALPGRVRQVITLGTPSANVSDSTNVGWLYALLNGGSDAVSRSLAATLKAPPPVPTTSIYSRSDGVVAWEACRLTPGPLAENIEVDSSHLGLVWHPDVLRVVADRLGQVEGKWTAYVIPPARHSRLVPRRNVTRKAL
jgi:pimeloyl-ACP methyl ester carboxylesterase